MHEINKQKIIVFLCTTNSQVNKQTNIQIQIYYYKYISLDWQVLTYTNVMYTNLNKYIQIGKIENDVDTNWPESPSALVNDKSGF